MLCLNDQLIYREESIIFLVNNDFDRLRAINIFIHVITVRGKQESPGFFTDF
jgi:hypothetical protein